MSRLEQVRLFAMTDVETYPKLLQGAPRLCQSAAAGTVAVVLRDRGLALRRRFELAQFLRRATADHGQLFFVSDRPDLARSVAADGVHLPADGFAPVDCREIWDGEISRSGHNLERLSGEDWAELDAVLVSPVCAPRKGRAALEMVGLQERALRISGRSPHVGVYALGGVTADRAQECLLSGARGVAAIGSAWDEAESGRLLQSLRICR